MKKPTQTPWTILLLGALLFSFTACKTTQNTTGDQMTKFELMENGAYCGISEAENHLITNSDDLAVLWKRFGSNRIPAPETPAVDFETSYVVASFLGMQTSGGHGYEISSMELSGGILMVKLLHSKPGQNCMVTDALTQPFVFAKINKENVESATFETETRVDDCDN